MRSLEQPARSVDIPDIVYFVRNGRAGAVATREQYEFIYKVSTTAHTAFAAPVPFDCRMIMFCFVHTYSQLANMYAARMNEEAADN